MGRSIVTLKKETPGFIVNRMLAALVYEAYELYDEGLSLIHISEPTRPY